MRIIWLAFISTLLSGCLFQHDTLNEVNYINGYYLYENNITQVNLNAGSLHNGSVTVVAENVDSIGHSDFYILGFAKHKYFLINRYDHKLDWYESREHISSRHKDVPEMISIRHVSEILHPKEAVDTPDLTCI